jgi:hypothetical protein
MKKKKTINNKEQLKGAGGVVESLPSKCKILSSNTVLLKKKKRKKEKEKNN